MLTTSAPQAAELRETDRRFANALVSSFKTDEWNETELLSVIADALRLIRKISTKYTDTSCMELQFEELEAEGRKKFIERLQKGVLKTFSTRDRRGELFKHLAACLSNHLKGILFRCRFTPKRMGRKVPTKGNGEYDRSWKPEVSLDDPEASSVMQRAASVGADNPLVDQDMQSLLTPVEFLVFKQLTEPNDGAMLEAWIDASRGRGKKENVHVSQINMAAGLGLPTEVFLAVTASVQTKFRKYMSLKSELIESDHHRAVAALEQAFDIQIPRSTDPKTVARVVTIAARANFEKMTPELGDLVRLAGGRPPVKDTVGNPTCFGALWQQNNRVCLQCALYSTCQVEANSAGLGELNLAPNLLPGRASIRTAAVTAHAPEAATAAATKSAAVTPMNLREDQLKTFMEQRFRGADFGTDRYYRNSSKKPGEKVKYIFWLGRKQGELRLRFCKPSEKLAAKLDNVERYSYLPLTGDWDALEKLVMQHSKETSGD